MATTANSEDLKKAIKDATDITCAVITRYLPEVNSIRPQFEKNTSEIIESFLRPLSENYAEYMTMFNVCIRPIVHRATPYFEGK